MPTSDDCSEPPPLAPSAASAEPLSRSILLLSSPAVSTRRRAALSSLVADSPPQDDSAVRERNLVLPSSPGHARRIAAPSDVFFDPMPSLSDAKDDCLSFVTARVSNGTACSVGACSTVSDFQDEDSRRNPGSSGDDDADDECSSSSSSWCSGWSSTAGGWWAKKPHQANDARWDAIRAVSIRDGRLGLGHFRLLERLGGGDIGCVYLAELRGKGSPLFAVKVMDKAALVSRKKLSRAQTEREILQCLDHPFLPTLYAHFETQNFSCLVMEFYSGGDLRDLQQRQPGKCFTETAARFYVAEVLLALEYLHMLGIIYRDLKPENLLVRDDGHIVLSDFDLSLRCAVFPTLVKSTKSSRRHSQPSCIEPSCMKHSCLQPTCFSPHLPGVRRSKASKASTTDVGKPDQTLPVLIAEPSSAHSMSFVGTHEYLAPEIIKGEGHGSAVDWWSFGILLYELLFGKTPFKGSGNRATLFNVVGEPLEFPEFPTISFAARDLIKGLLMKEPQQRLAYRHGTAELKRHPFFQSINWALIRCGNPPELPKMNKFKVGTSGDFTVIVNGNMVGVNVKPSGKYLDMDFF